MNNLENFLPYQWMADAPQLDKLTLFELTLPGTHNAGCDLEADYAIPLSQNWLACQDVSFYSQLNRGARALDMRLLLDAQAQGLARFRFHHNGSRSSRTLEDLVRDIKGFYERSRDEFIILDFHELANGVDAFDHVQFKMLLLEHLGERMIPAQNLHLTLGQLKAVDPLQRIMVAAPMTWETDDPRIHRQIDHKWIGKSLVGTTDLHAYIADVLSRPTGRLRPWSLSATCYSLGGPQRILASLDDWFDPARSDWAKKCHIINFDFIKKSNIVRYCLTANLQKALDKSA
ncbi:MULTISPECIES: phospholipase [unclassified Pseudomonas]|uniref:phospholipase n=1 Tax=unclassified Pseudomonas TaxID=196821 RepID=UPI00215C303B|nr:MULTISPECIES: phospholipase [unclassified Pseudomonas]MCR8931429.1 phospholipase [Pseudomonas sp. S11A4]MCR8975036.1 phospholipase [Pseudomonas sp. S11P7]